MLKNEQKFSHVVNCIPYVVRDDKDKADCFERGLRSEIFKVVHVIKLQTFAEVLDQALWVEQGNAIAREERESCDLDNRARQQSGATGGQLNIR